MSLKRLTLLLSTFGTTAAWYVLSNKKIRDELGKAENPEETVKILTRHLGRDASKIAHEVHDLMRSPEVQESLAKAKQFTDGAVSKAKSGFGGLFTKGKAAFLKLKAGSSK